MGSQARDVLSPSAISFIASPIGMQAMIGTGSEKIGLRRILSGFKSSAFIERVLSGRLRFEHGDEIAQKLHGQI
jgi:hypothetical protein